MKKNYLFYAILSLAFIYSCDKDNDSITDTSAEKDTDSKDLVVEYSYILDGEKYDVQVDYSSDEPQISQTEDFLAISDVLESSETVEYYNPEIDGMVLFRNSDELINFTNNKKEQQSLKNKFRPQNLNTGSTDTMSKIGPVPGTTTPSVSIYSGAWFEADTFTTSRRFRSDDLYQNTHLTNGIKFNDNISSMIVVNAFAAFWEDHYSGHLLVIDSYSYRMEIDNLQDLKLKASSMDNWALIIRNGSMDGSALCGWLCNSWNDEITSMAINVDGSKFETMPGN